MPRSLLSAALLVLTLLTAASSLVAQSDGPADEPPAPAAPPPPSNLRLGGAPATPDSGARSELPTVLVSRQLAEEEALSAGDTVELVDPDVPARASTFRVAGIYEPTPDPMRLGDVRREVRLHLPDLLALTREDDVAAGTEHVGWVNIALDATTDAAQVARDINARLPGAAARPAEGDEDAAGAFVVLERFHFAIALVTIVASTVFLLALTIMLVDERRSTVGVLRLIGLPSGRILTQVLVEGLLIAGVGTVFGLMLAVGSESLINGFFQWRYDTALVFVRISPRVAAICAAIAVPLGAVATVAASWALLRRGGLRLARR
ncbi:MAG: ABC transporter permease [Vicinamibacterales bacterium]